MSANKSMLNNLSLNCRPMLADKIDECRPNAFIAAFRPSSVPFNKIGWTIRIRNSACCTSQCVHYEWKIGMIIRHFLQWIEVNSVHWMHSILFFQPCRRVRLHYDLFLPCNVAVYNIEDNNRVRTCSRPTHCVSFRLVVLVDDILYDEFTSKLPQ